MSVVGTWAIVVTDELGQHIARRYETLTAVQRARARDGEAWAVVAEVLDDDTEQEAA